MEVANGNLDEKTDLGYSDVQAAQIDALEAKELKKKWEKVMKETAKDKDVSNQRGKRRLT